MPNLNKVMLMGNLTRDPEVKYTPKGTAVAQFGLAINRKWKPEGGEEREEVTFVDIECFGRMAEVVGEHFKRGKPMFVEGRLKLDQWDDKTTGKKMSKLRVIMETFEFLGGNREAAPNEEADARAAAGRRAPAAQPSDTQGDDVP
jgi:single-strand DNA-binding protein